jgi:hypothetical protein
VSMQQYGQLAVMAKEAFRAMLSLPGNIVIVAQERTFGGKDDGIPADLIRPTVGAALTPSIAGWLNPACDYVVQMYKRPKIVQRPAPGVSNGQTIPIREGVDYCLRCEPHDVYMTKFRLPKGRPVPAEIVDPSYEKLMAVINGGKV